MSSFEMVQRYVPAFSGLLQSELSHEICNAYQEQAVFKPQRALERSNTLNFDSAQNFSHGKKVYDFNRGPKFGEWHKAYVRETEMNMHLLSANLDHRWKAKTCTYEDVRKVPSSSLLQDLNAFEMLFPQSDSITTRLLGVLSNEKIQLTAEPEHLLEVQLPENETGLQGELQTYSKISLGHENSVLNFPKL